MSNPLPLFRAALVDALRALGIEREPAHAIANNAAQAFPEVLHQAVEAHGLTLTDEQADQLGNALEHELAEQAEAIADAARQRAVLVEHIGKLKHEAHRGIVSTRTGRACRVIVRMAGEVSDCTHAVTIAKAGDVPRCVSCGAPAPNIPDVFTVPYTDPTTHVARYERALAEEESADARA